jgi:hypothetical protein
MPVGFFIIESRKADNIRQFCPAHPQSASIGHISFKCSIRVIIIAKYVGLSKHFMIAVLISKYLMKTKIVAYQAFF